MADPYFTGATLDDVMHHVFKSVLSDGDRITPTKGPAIELRGVLLEITNPRARLSRTETRGKPFSCLGELCWYLARSDQLDFIAYYIPDYDKYADGATIFGAYGPRLFDHGGIDQVTSIIKLLQRKPDSRQAVIQLFEASDIREDHKDIPCTNTLQFLLRDGKLHMITSMRSNDAYIGMPHDIFAFTMLQEVVARSLSADIGSYKHVVGSLHVYADKIDQAKQYLAEGWQSTTPMPPMPAADPWSAIGFLMAAESSLRLTGRLPAFPSTIDDYWGDLIRLLQILRCSKDGDAAAIEGLRSRMGSQVYDTFIQQRLADVKSKQ